MVKNHEFFINDYEIFMIFHYFMATEVDETRLASKEELIGWCMKRFGLFQRMYNFRTNGENQEAILYNPGSSENGR